MKYKTKKTPPSPIPHDKRDTSSMKLIVASIPSVEWAVLDDDTFDKILLFLERSKEYLRICNSNDAPLIQPDAPPEITESDLHIYLEDLNKIVKKNVLRPESYKKSMSEELQAITTFLREKEINVEDMVTDSKYMGFPNLPPIWEGKKINGYDVGSSPKDIGFILELVLEKEDVRMVFTKPRSGPCYWTNNYYNK